MDPIFGDYNNDGWQDIFVSDMRYHRLFRNPGGKGFCLDTTVGNRRGQRFRPVRGLGRRFLRF